MPTVRRVGRSLAALCILAAAVPRAGAQPVESFAFPSFTPEAHATLQIMGSAHVTDGKLRLTTPHPFLVGGVYHRQQVDIQPGWETSFRYHVGECGGLGCADGLAFVIQRAAVTALGANGARIGYADGAIHHALAVEFDVWPNPPHEPASRHVAVQSCGYGVLSLWHWSEDPVTGASRRCTDGTPPSFGVVDAETAGDHEVTIRYTGSGTVTNPPRFEVILDSQLLFSEALDLVDLTGGTSAWIGFTAATGEGMANQDLLSWSFQRVVPEPATILLAGVGLGCMGLVGAARRRRARRA